MAKSNKKILESDLYPAVRDYLVEQGYTVRGEVKDCDVTATKDDDLIVIELKRGLTIDLLIQATQRQRATDSVYVAVPRPKGGIYAKRWRGLISILKRLELGLIIVSFMGKTPNVDVVFDPLPFERKRSKEKRRAIIKEHNGRSGDYNKGGSTRKKIVTAYRENAIFLACCLDKFGEMKPKQMRELGTGPKTTPILYANFYGWFKRVERGTYEITPKGKKALKEYKKIAKHFRKKLKEQDSVE